MEQTVGLRKVMTSNNSSLRSPNVSGRSSPFSTTSREQYRPMSPNLSRQNFPLRRPPSSSRLHQTEMRAPSPADSKYNVYSSDSRPASSLSNRSTSTPTGQLRASENTLVSVRIKPVDSKTIHQSWIRDGRCIKTTPGAAASALEYMFDHVFDEDSTNQQVYDAGVSKLVAGVLDGFHGTVFAYGMTGTGKTFSMQGSRATPGIIPLAVRDLFKNISQKTNDSYSMKMSYLEIYNEKIRDLLSGSLNDGEEIKIRDDPRRGIHAFPLTETVIHSEDDFLTIMAKGDALRHNAATDYNAHSSRSHAVIQIIVQCTKRVLDTNGMTAGSSRLSTLNLIDLAGSERAATDIERRKEGAYINKSLLTLGTVIARLTSSGTQSAMNAHVPFRDSKITRLLQNALSGFSLVSILATVNVDSAFIMETTNTLKFASRAKFIPGRAQKAEPSGSDPAMVIASLRTEVSNLRAQLSASQNAIAHLQQVVRQLESSTYSPHSTVLSREFCLDDIHEDMNDTNGGRGPVLKESLANQKSVGQSLPPPSQVRVLRQDEASVHSGLASDRESLTGGMDSSPDSQSSMTQGMSQSTSVPDRQGTYLEDNEKESKDHLDALADKVLASAVLKRSQRSRDEARNLTLQIAQLKNREDRKTSPSARLGIWGQIVPTGGIRDKEEPVEAPLEIRSPLPHTLVSPMIRAPRDGFI